MAFNGMGGCNTCTGGCNEGCSGCSGCGKELVLSVGEMELLRTLGQYSFLPIARKADDMTPIYKEEQAYSEEEYSVIIQLLERKQLICLDYTPLSGAKMGPYSGYPIHGSMGLTQYGQQVLESLELLGARE